MTDRYKVPSTYLSTEYTKMRGLEKEGYGHGYGHGTPIHRLEKEDHPQSGVTLRLTNLVGSLSALWKDKIGEAEGRREEKIAPVEERSLSLSLRWNSYPPPSQ